jgi:hypothetical protein
VPEVSNSCASVLLHSCRACHTSSAPACKVSRSWSPTPWSVVFLLLNHSMGSF